MAAVDGNPQPDQALPPPGRWRWALIRPRDRPHPPHVKRPLTARHCQVVARQPRDIGIVPEPPRASLRSRSALDAEQLCIGIAELPHPVASALLSAISASRTNAGRLLPRAELHRPHAWFATTTQTKGGAAALVVSPNLERPAGAVCTIADLSSSRHLASHDRFVAIAIVAIQQRAARGALSHSPSRSRHRVRRRDECLVAKAVVRLGTARIVKALVSQDAILLEHALPMPPRPAQGCSISRARRDAAVSTGHRESGGHTRLPVLVRIEATPPPAWTPPLQASESQSVC